MASFYFLILSPQLARFSPIISLRNKYISVFGKKVSSYSFSSIRPIRTDSRTGLFVYGLKGRLTKIDPEKDLITLTADDKKEYLISIDVIKNSDDGWVTIQGIIDNMEGTRTIDYQFYVPDLSVSTVKDEKSTLDRIYHFMWQDKRILAKIIDDLKTRSNIPVNTYEEIISIGLFR